MSSGGESATPEWRELTIPDGEPPVLVRRLLHDRDSGGVTTLVRFPAGWRRPVTGHYVVDEEALFVEGSFRMSGLEYPGVTYAYFPAGYLREGSVSTDGAFSIASFGGRADWRRGPSGDAVGSIQGVRIADWRALPVMAAPPGLGPGGGRLLRSHGAGSTWMLEDPPSGAVPDGANLELFSLGDHTWIRLGPGAPIPTIAGPVYCRLLTRRGSVSSPSEGAAIRDRR